MEEINNNKNNNNNNNYYYDNKEMCMSLLFTSQSLKALRHHKQELLLYLAGVGVALLHAAINDIMTKNGHGGYSPLLCQLKTDKQTNKNCCLIHTFL